MATSPSNIQPSNEVSLARIRRRQSIRTTNKDTDSLRPSSVAEVLEDTTDHLIHVLADNQCSGTIRETVSGDGDVARSQERSLAKSIAVVIHHTDNLRANIHLRQPVVRVSMIDVKSGQYVKKTRPDLCAVSYYERQNEALDYILPIQTQPFNPGQNRSVLLPSWEESLIINEDTLKLNEDTVFFFEILSLPTMCPTWAESRQAQGWYKIAWSFLRPTRPSLLGKKCRLQLYVYPSQQAEVYLIWAHQKMAAYPGTLYVTVKSTTHTGQTLTTLRSMGPYQREEGTIPLEQLVIPSRPNAGVPVTGAGVAPPHTSPWVRMPGQSCQVPNRLHKILTCTPGTTPGTTHGCSALSFSPDGRFLACAGVTGTSYPVTIWEYPSWTLVLSSDDHRGLVYNFSWCSQSTHVASASADSVCRVWSLERPVPALTLPHPCYVYAVQFAATATTVCTAAFDTCVRVWRLHDSSVDLIAELREHGGLVNCLAWDVHRSLLYSCDSDGGMCVWSIQESPLLQRKVTVLKGDSIHHIVLHSSGKKALIRTAKVLIMFDLRIDKVVHTYTLPSAHTCSLISPCGTLVFSGTNDGCLYAWITDSSEEQPIRVSCLQKMAAISSMAFHPTENVIAVSAVAPYQPIVVLVYENSMNNT